MRAALLRTLLAAGCAAALATSCTPSGNSTALPPESPESSTARTSTTGESADPLTGIRWTFVTGAVEGPGSLLLRQDGTAEVRTACRSGETTWTRTATGFRLAGADLVDDPDGCVDEGFYGIVRLPELLDVDVTAVVREHMLMVSRPGREHGWNSQSGPLAFYDPAHRTTLTAKGSVWLLVGLTGTETSDLPLMSLEIDEGIGTIRDANCIEVWYELEPVTDSRFELGHDNHMVLMASCARAPSPRLTALREALITPGCLDANEPGCGVLAGTIENEETISVVAGEWTFRFRKI
ncbi:hypothetical protein GIS00_02425 [Nakamurella sp. YIM 132087]|uniref:META domain-containing protein n=1 Tax=Nakamurella alba TaxID=2665158 RepID=A0A7K1FFE6_9ACTN|nr:hypothetical protein [Nakamurella alba]MTD12800.1 hypothetical protein [Nakamurella alba]